jgi:hypothetical protein
MRQALVLAVLAMVASVALAAAPEPVKPYMETQTGITFPVTLGQLALKDASKLEKPELGVMIDYQATGDVYARACVFIFDGGKKDLPTGVESAEVKAAFDQAKNDIEKNERYKDIKTVAEKPFTLKIGDKELPMLSATFQYGFTPEKGAKAGSAQTVTSHLFITAFKGDFLKIRCTYTDAVKGNELMQGFLTALGETIK